MNRRIRIVPVWNPKPNVGLLAQALIGLARAIQAEEAERADRPEEADRG